MDRATEREQERERNRGIEKKRKYKSKVRKEVSWDHLCMHVTIPGNIHIYNVFPVWKFTLRILKTWNKDFCFPSILKKYKERKPKSCLWRLRSPFYVEKNFFSPPQSRDWSIRVVPPVLGQLIACWRSLCFLHIFTLKTIVFFRSASLTLTQWLLIRFDSALDSQVLPLLCSRLLLKRITLSSPSETPLTLVFDSSIVIDSSAGVTRTVLVEQKKTLASHSGSSLGEEVIPLDYIHSFTFLLRFIDCPKRLWIMRRSNRRENFVKGFFS